MKHARDDYNRIQDPSGLIPKDEPVFLLRGQDKLAPGVVLTWAERLETRQPGNSLIQPARDQAMKMLEWQKANKAKVPDGKVPEKPSPYKPKTLSGLRLKYFVLKPEGSDIYAKASREALSAYAEVVSEHNPELADDLVNWVEEEELLF